MSTTQSTNLLHDLNHFTGTEAYHRLGFLPLHCTDGVKFLAEHGGANGAFWLVDAIASHLFTNHALRKAHDDNGLHLWTVTLTDDGGCVLECREDTDTPTLVRQVIEYTDLGTNLGGQVLKLYCQPGEVLNAKSEVVEVLVLMVPSEY